VQDLEATNSSAQARLDDVSLEIDTLQEGDSAAPANGKYLNFVAHMYVADLTTSGTLPCGGRARCIQMVSSLSSGMSIETRIHVVIIV
jgi:hypothetical protein